MVNNLDNQDNDSTHDADRGVPNLRNAGSDKMMQTASLIGLLVFAGFVISLAVKSQKAESAAPEVEAQAAYNAEPVPSQRTEIPVIEPRRIEAPVIEKREPAPRVRSRLPDPRLLEVKAANNQQKIDNTAALAKRDQNRRAPLLVFNVEPEPTSYIAPETSSAYNLAQDNANAINSLNAEREQEISDRESRNESFSDKIRQRELDAQSEAFQTKEERFLRDVGELEIDIVEATLLQNQEYLITQGSTIAGTLDTAIQSDLSGMLRASTTRDVYGRTGEIVLVPRGSKLVGRYQSGVENGQTRVFIIWTRVERPDGIVINIASGGTDTLGRAGLGGEVDTHFFKKFGTSFLFSIVGSTIVALSDAGDNNSNSTQIIQDGGDSFNRNAEIVLEKQIEIPPTIHVDQGAKINIFVAKDLSFKQALESIQ